VKPPKAEALGFPSSATAFRLLSSDTIFGVFGSSNMISTITEKILFLVFYLALVATAPISTLDSFICNPHSDARVAMLLRFKPGTSAEIEDHTFAGKALQNARTKNRAPMLYAAFKSAEYNLPLENSTQP
jgi:hypothetical protein